jgi:hypothetical protein
MPVRRFLREGSCHGADHCRGIQDVKIKPNCGAPPAQQTPVLTWIFSNSILLIITGKVFDVFRSVVTYIAWVTFYEDDKSRFLLRYLLFFY